MCRNGLASVPRRQRSYQEGSVTMRAITFGEVMLRLCPPDHRRLTQTDIFEASFGGSESNVAVSLATFGLDVDYVTRLPENDIGDACVQYLRRYGVGTRYILRGGDRIGIYFLEHGAVHRGSKVVYDRRDSAVAGIKPGTVDWQGAFEGADWFHWTGITAAISEGAADVCLEAVRTAKEHGLRVSCDLNYRAKLWKWGKTAGEVMEGLVGLCDVAVANEEDAAKVFGIHAPDTEVTSGRVEADKYQYVCRALSQKFPNLKMIAITLRGSISASHNTWSGILWHDGELFRGATYDITHIVDRVGAGDAFVGGLIYGLSTFGGDYRHSLDFALAASCLKHTITGDLNLVGVGEVEKVMKGDTSGRVMR